MLYGMLRTREFVDRNGVQVMQNEQTILKQIIGLLCKSKIPTVEKSYGFCITHHELDGCRENLIECGLEHNGSISISVKTAESPPIKWFFRFDLSEMADFLIKSYEDAGYNASRSQIVESMLKVDLSYDYEYFDKRLEQLNLEF